MSTPKFFMVFDCESVGLHGEGYAAAFVTVDQSGEIVGCGCYACSPDDAKGQQRNREWIAQNAPSLTVDCLTPRAVRNAFWRAWIQWRTLGAVLVADCAWPVEARFLMACVDDDPEGREWEGPYPLHDLASVLMALGQDPLATRERLPEELPVHDPLNDAKQSARLLIEALKSRGGQL